jgi:hypothetical protein
MRALLHDWTIHDWKIHLLGPIPLFWLSRRMTAPAWAKISASHRCCPHLRDPSSSSPLSTCPRWSCVLQSFLQCFVPRFDQFDRSAVIRSLPLDFQTIDFPTIGSRKIGSPSSSCRGSKRSADSGRRFASSMQPPRVR